jgi:Protein of unknown function (DUF1653)
MSERFVRHKKGGYYEVQGRAKHSETLEEMVIYRSIKDRRADEETWVRPASMFDGVDESGVPRFAPVTDDDFVRVEKYAVQCPGCYCAVPVGEFKTHSGAANAARIQSHCPTCDEGFDEYDESDWVMDTSLSRLLRPLAARHLEGVQE